MALNLTAVGTIVGFVLSNGAPIDLVLVVPLLSPTLGLLWLDHHVNIHRIGRYIRTELWTWTPSWEEHITRQRQAIPWRALIFWPAIFVVFFVDALVALIVGWPGWDGSDGGVRTLWCGGVLMSLIYVLAYIGAMCKNGWRLGN